MRTAILLTLITVLTASCKDQPETQRGFALVNGTSLYYEISGDGENLILVHGNFGDRRQWDPQFKELSKKFRVMRYDVRGYGKSAMPKSEEPYYDTEDLKDLMEYLDIKKAHFCGISMGSGIIIDFGLEHPEKCKSLISAGPWVTGYGSDEYKTPASDSLFAVVGRTIGIAREKGSVEATDYFWKGNNIMKRAAVGSKPALDSLLKIGYAYTFWGFLIPIKRSYTSPPAIKRLEEIRIPTLIVTSDNNVEASTEVAEIMHKRISGSKLVSVKHAGHMVNMDKPDKFNRLVSHFVSGHRN